MVLKKGEISMELFYCTFGNGTNMSGYYQPVYAENDEQAWNTMLNRWGKAFAFSYSSLEFSESMKKGFYKDLKPLPVLYARQIITVGEMKRLTDRLIQITSASQILKNKRLKNMLKDVKMAYNPDPFVSRLIKTIEEEISA